MVLENSRRGVIVFFSLLLCAAAALMFWLEGGITLSAVFIMVMMAVVFTAAPPLVSAGTAAVCALVGVLLAGPLNTALSFLIMLPAAVAAAAAVRRGTPFKKAVLLTLAVSAVVFALLFCVGIHRAGHPLSPEGALLFVRSFIADTVADFASILEEAQSSSSQSSAYLSQGTLAGISVSQLAETLRLLLTQCIAGVAGFTAVLYAGAAVAGAKLGARLAGAERAQTSQEFSVSKIGAALFIIAGFISLFSGTAGVVAVNFAFVMLPALIFEGTGFIAQLYKRRMFGGTMLFIVFGAMFLFQPVTALIAVAVMGSVHSLFGSRILKT